ncbi:hypothetical protein CBOM_07594 [Ceraceosorus bombacis]|uniref:Uncharacterized protein n=1 Tax=Ceraceosorus bombacis TaxID=401625 RepID=A0A0N7L9X0_9BASI|nr:hypothetical protein CBOM_07594 [Ceraceosorus bombacis]
MRTGIRIADGRLKKALPHALFSDVQNNDSAGQHPLQSACTNIGDSPCRSPAFEMARSESS